MPSNHLEDMIAQWYEYKGYYVIRNNWVGKRSKGGYECELDIVAYHPKTKHLVQIEPSLDASAWAKREERYKKKFAAGQKYGKGLFEGLPTPKPIEQIAVLAYGNKTDHPTLAGGKVLFIGEVLVNIFKDIASHKLGTSTIPEHLPTLRTLQFVAEHWKDIEPVLKGRAS
jgi:hypothetical protein